MYVQIGSDQLIVITEIIAVVHPEQYVPSAFVRLLVPQDAVKSYVVTDDFVYGSPYRTQALLKKIEQNRL
jgi:FAD synthase